MILKSFWWWYWEDAINAANTGTALYPDDPSIISATAALRATGQIESALRTAKARTRRFPEDADSWDELARTYLVLGFPDSGETAWRTAIKFDWGWKDYDLPLCKYHAGDLDEAISDFEEILSRPDLSNRARLDIMYEFINWLRLPFMYYEAGRYDDAADIMDEALQYIGDDRSYWQYYAGALFTAIGSPGRALQIAAEMEKSDEIRTRIFALRFKGMAQVAAGDLQGARATAAGAFKTGVTAYSGYKTNAAIALTEKDPVTALENLEQMKQIAVMTGNLYHIQHQDMLAAAYEMAGDLEKAIEVHRELLRIYGGHAISHYQLGRLYEKTERPADAATHYATFLEMWKNADEGLPQLVDSRERFNRLQAGVN